MKTILITGSTDGIGLAAAEYLIDLGHQVIIHGRNQAKLDSVAERIKPHAAVQADLSSVSQTKAMADEIAAKYDSIDVLINNAGVLNVDPKVTSEGVSTHFAVNTLAPYILTTRLKDLLKNTDARVINLSSAAQATPNVDDLVSGNVDSYSDMAIYAQTKLALSWWTKHLADSDRNPNISYLSLNPGSLINTNMVRDAFGGHNLDLSVGRDILVATALDQEFGGTQGQYYDNDAKRFADFDYDQDSIDYLVSTLEQLAKR